MILAGHQSHYLPGMRFFAKILLSDKFILVDHVQFVKKEWQNRNKIKTQNEPMWLSVPVLVKDKPEQKISEVEIDNKPNWQRTHRRAIEINYSRADYFDSYKGFFKKIYSRKWEKLVDINLEIISFLLKELGIEKEILMSSTFDFQGKSTDLLIEMCKRVNADTYISGQQSKDYVDVSKFKENGLKHFFIKFSHPNYRQQFGDFIPNLSTIDALFNCGGKETHHLIERSVEFEKP